MVSSVTVVVCTFRRPAGLTALLGALATQDDPGIPWDVVVVDNDEPPGAGPAFSAAAAAVPVPTRLVHEPRRGSAHARNRGIAEADGDVVAILDDDVVPAPDWLRAIVAPIRDGRCEGTGGTVVLDPAVPRPPWLDEDGIGGYLTAFAPSDVERPLAGEEYVVTASCAFRADVLRRSGGFDPALGPRDDVQLVNDDVLLCRRFRAAGGRIRHVPGAVVVHELPKQRLHRSWLLRRAYQQGRSDWIVDADRLRRRRLRGAGYPPSWLAAELRLRRREGLRRPEVRFHLACDVVRTAGLAREALRTMARR